ncbi:hypothetical protein [Marinobacter sp.]|uniref:hypothetical protein n=1 Tax=Marinobacter sp. TaxID=50741 RepID=UPI003A8EE47E
MESQVLLKDKTLSNSGIECCMRVRVSLRALWALKDMKQLMNPANNSLFSPQLISHKLFRYTGFATVATLAISALYLVPVKALYALPAVGYALFLYCTSAGYKEECYGQSSSTAYGLPYYFVLLNLASFKAFFAFFKGVKQVVWNPRRG